MPRYSIAATPGRLRLLNRDIRPVVPARLLADVIETGTAYYAEVIVLPGIGIVLAVQLDKVHSEVGTLIFRGWEYSHVHHCAYVRLSLRRQA